MNYKKFSVGIGASVEEHKEAEPIILKEELSITGNTPIQQGASLFPRITSRLYKYSASTLLGVVVLLLMCLFNAPIPGQDQIENYFSLLLTSESTFSKSYFEYLLPVSDEKNIIYSIENGKNIEDKVYNIANYTDTAVEEVQSESAVPSKDYSSKYLTITNETNYAITVDEILLQQYPIVQNEPSEYESTQVFSAAKPEVLIIHTHGTECYSTDKSGKYTNAVRSSNSDSNVVAIGRELKSVLNENGIEVIHCEEMFDKDSYIKSYSNSYAAVNEYLKKYPSIKYVIDLHRDAISDSNGNYIKSLTEKDGENIAQLMFVIGTDSSGANHKQWRDNLKVALELQQDILLEHNSLMRPLYLRKASFNQQLSPGYFILEAGTCANRFDEVVPAIRLFGESFAKSIKKEV